jgi:hypothetical protein
MKINKSILIFALILILFHVGCSDKQKPTEPETNTMATVTITISTSDGGSVNGATVRLRHNSNSSHDFTRTASSNSVQITNVPYGTYILTVSHTGYSVFTNSNVSVQSATVHQSATLQVIPVNRGTVNISLVPSGAVSLVGAVVNLTNDANNSISFTRTVEALILVQITEVPYGTYTLKVTHDGYNTHESSVSVQSAFTTHTANMTALQSIIVHIQNNISGDGCSFHNYYYRIAGTSTWLLAGGSILGNPTPVTLQGSHSSRYDFRAIGLRYEMDPVPHNATERYTLSNVTASHNGTITLNNSHRDSKPQISIRNNTGVVLGNEVTITSSIGGTSSSYTYNLAGNLSNDATSAPFTLVSMSLDDVYSIMVRIADGYIFFFKNNIEIIGNTTLTFTMDDRP